MAKKGVAKHGISVRLACVVYGISETCYRYQATLDEENALVADWLLKLTQTKKQKLQSKSKHKPKQIQLKLKLI